MSDASSTSTTTAASAAGAVQPHSDNSATHKSRDSTRSGSNPGQGAAAHPAEEEATAGWWATIKWTLKQFSTHFSGNPYKLPALVYILLGLSLLAWLVANCLVALDVVWPFDPTASPEEKEYRQQSLESFKAAFSSLPVLVQFCLFLFPPLLAA